MSNKTIQSSEWEIVHNLDVSDGVKKRLKQFLNDVARLTDQLTSHELFSELEILRRRSTRKNPLQNIDGAIFNALIGLITDLTITGWQFCFDKHLSFKQPRIVTRADKRIATNAASYSALLPSTVQQRVAGLEKSRYFGDRLISIFSLMRDGAELSAKVKDFARDYPETSLKSIIDPYIQVVTAKTTCGHTGLGLGEIWWYFRQTWSTPYESTPGRTVQFLIRDRATEKHCVIGIGALSSAIIQHRVRDEFIGWDSDQFLREITEHPTNRIWNWVNKTVEDEIQYIYVNDFIKRKELTARELIKPTTATICRLQELSKKERILHNKRGAAAKTTKGWKEKAETHLFRAKRSGELAILLRIRMILGEHEHDPKKATNQNIRFNPKQQLRNLLKQKKGRDAIRTVIRYARNRAVGSNIAEMSVCGAIEPYATILGGKLVSLLMASPEVSREYNNRYKNQVNEIASGMAGREIRRPSNLVFLATTSLYGQPNQYTRLSVPVKDLGGTSQYNLKYQYLGKTKGTGTLQFSKTTIEAFHRLTMETESRRVNYVFGEGGGAKLRAIRQTLKYLGLNEDTLLQHGTPRSYYGIKLIKNTRNYLLGIDKTPQHFVPRNNFRDSTKKLTTWWEKRWLIKRLQRSDAKELHARLEQHSFVEPVRHGARITLPKSDLEQGVLF